MFRVLIFVPILFTAIGCSAEADVDARIDTQLEAKLASPEFKQMIDTRVTETLSAESTQTTGSWGVSIGTLKVDSLTLIIVIAAVALIGWLLYKKGRLGKVIDVLVNRNEAHGDQEHKKFIQEDAELAGVENVLSFFVKKNTEKK